jgi:LacI family transcriptional regulator
LSLTHTHWGGSDHTLTDNVRYSKYLPIPLTSVDQSTAQLGEAAAQLAMDLVAKKVDKPKNILLPPSLVVRSSTIGSSAQQPLVCPA